MQEQLVALYEVQSLDVKIARVRAALSALDGARGLKQRLQAAKAKAQEAEGKLVDLETDLKDSELKLKSVEDKRSSTEKRLYGGIVSNPRELQALEKEVQILKEQQGKLDGRTLELYDSVDAARSETRAAESDVHEIERQVEEALANESTDRARLEAELAESSSARERAALAVTDKALMARYEAVRKKAGITGIAKVVAGKCEGCHVAVTGFTLRKLAEGEGFELCENCGRILMLDAE